MQWPVWISLPLAAVMVGIATYEVVRLVVLPVSGRARERDVDGFHLAMGIVMAAMLTGRLTPFGAEVWAVLFGATTVWFAVRVPPAVAVHTTASRSVAHRASHVVSSAAMVFMLLAEDRRAGDPKIPAMATMPAGAAWAAGAAATALLMAAAVAVRVVAHRTHDKSAPEPPVSPGVSAVFEVGMGVVMTAMLLAMV